MGIGPGATPPDFEMFKITDLDRMEMLVESIDMIHGIWASDPPYEFHGKYWDFVIKDNVLTDIGVGGMGKPYQKPHPPVMIPAMSRGSGSIRLAARRGWSCISANFVPDDVLKGHWRDYLDECRTLGQQPDPSMWKAGRTLLITETDEEARQYLRREDNAFRWYFEYIIGVTSHGGFVHMLKSDPDMPDEEVTPEYCIDTIVTAGSPKTVAKKIAEFRDETGPFETLIVSHHDWVHKDLWAAPHGVDRDRADAEAPRRDRLAGGGGVGRGGGGGVGRPGRRCATRAPRSAPGGWPRSWGR